MSYPNTYQGVGVSNIEEQKTQVVEELAAVNTYLLTSLHKINNALTSFK